MRGVAAQVWETPSVNGLIWRADHTETDPQGTPRRVTTRKFLVLASEILDLSEDFTRYVEGQEFLAPKPNPEGR